MKTVEIKTSAGLIQVREIDLPSYKAKGATMPDGSEIKIGVQEEKVVKEDKPKSKPKKKSEKKKESEGDK